MNKKAITAILGTSAVAAIVVGCTMNKEKITESLFDQSTVLYGPVPVEKESETDSDLEMPEFDENGSLIVESEQELSSEDIEIINNSLFSESETEETSESSEEKESETTELENGSIEDNADTPDQEYNDTEEIETADTISMITLMYGPSPYDN